MIQGPGGSALDLDDLLQRIREIENELEAVPDDFGERIRLREQQRELRAMAARLSQRERAPADIARELEHLKRLRAEIMDGHLSAGHVGGGNGPGGGGIEPRDVFAMNKAIDKAWDRAELERRIERLQRELGESPDVDEPG